MAEIEKKEQQNASFAANYIDETIKADSDSRVKAFVKKFEKKNSSFGINHHSFAGCYRNYWTIHCTV